MIMTSIDFHLKPGKHKDLKKVFEKYRIFDRAFEIKGCWKLVMIKPKESDDFVQVWLDNPERSLGTDDMLPLLNTDWDKSAPGQILEVLLSEPKSTGAWSKPA